MNQKSDMYSFKKIIGLSLLYDLALMVLSFGTVFLEFSMTKVVDTEVTWILFLPWPTDHVKVNPLCYAAGILLACAGCYFLGKWHGSVLARKEEFTKGQKAGYIILLILAIVLCLLAESIAYVLMIFDATVKGAYLFVTVSFLLIPVWMVITEIRNRGDGCATSAMIDELKRF